MEVLHRNLKPDLLAKGKKATEASKQRAGAPGGTNQSTGPVSLRGSLGDQHRSPLRPPSESMWELLGAEF